MSTSTSVGTQSTVMDDLLQHAEDVPLFRAGDSVKGCVINANGHRTLLDLEGGMTGIITKKEAVNFNEDDDALAEGAEIVATIIDPENENGLVVLSLRKASQDMAWAELNELMSEGRIIKVKIDEANKGGLMAKFKGLRAFLPVSQLAPLNYPRVENADSGEILSRLQGHIGKEFAVRIMNVDREEGKIIISEKLANEGEMRKTLGNLQVGDRAKGVVSGVVRYGIFVAFGGVEGLVHVSELDWGHVADPSKRYSINDQVEVMVIGVDGEKLSFSIKRLSEDPWVEKAKAYEEGQKVIGRVVRWNDNGVYIEIEKDIQGLLKLEEMGVESASGLKIKEGDELKGEITKVNTDSHRLELKKV